MISSKGKLKFSWKELFSNGDGRTSGSSFIGVTTGLVCLLLFTLVVLFYFFHTGEGAVVLNIIDKITIYFGISAALLGVNKITSKFGNGTVYNIGTCGDEKKETITTKQIKCEILEEDVENSESKEETEK